MVKKKLFVWNIKFRKPTTRLLQNYINKQHYFYKVDSKMDNQIK